MSTKLDFTELGGRDFSGYYMMSNPFPDIPIPEEEPEFVADRIEVIDSVYDVTSQCILSGNSSSLLLLGVNGSGKSHILKYIKSRINLQLTKKDKKGISVYVRNPNESIYHLYNSIIDELGKDFLEQLTAKCVVKYLYENDDIAEFFSRSTDLEEIKDIINSSYNINPLNYKKLYSYQDFKSIHLYRKISESIGSKTEDYVITLLRLLDDRYKNLAWRWIFGDSLSSNERNSLNVNRNIEEDDYVLDAIYDLKNMLLFCDYNSLFILLDEAEDIVDLHHIKQGNYIQSLRHLIDDNPKGICIIVCIAPSAWGQLRTSGPALSRRLMYRSERLNKFKDNDVEELVKLYLEKERKKYCEEKEIDFKNIYDIIKQEKKVEQPEIYPFNKKTLNHINLLSDGLVSTIILYCKKLLDEGIRLDYVYYDEVEKVSDITGE